MAEFVDYNGNEVLDLDYVSNPNLLANSNFIYWTQGESLNISNLDMGPDAWWCRCSKVSKNTTNGGIDFTSLDNQVNYIDQSVSANANFFNGKTITISINIDGTIYTATGTVNSSADKIKTYIRGSESVNSREGIILSYETNRWYVRYFNDYIATTVNIRWIKLEYGNRRTEGLETEFDDAMRSSETILKLYSWRNTFTLRGDGSAYYITIPKTKTFQNYASLTTGVSINLYGLSDSGVFAKQTVSTSSLNVIHFDTNTITVVITRATGNATINLGWAIFTQTAYLKFR